MAYRCSVMAVLVVVLPVFRFLDEAPVPPPKPQRTE